MTMRYARTQTPSVSKTGGRRFEPCHSCQPNQALARDFGQLRKLAEERDHDRHVRWRGLNAAQIRVDHAPARIDREGIAEVVGGIENGPGDIARRVVLASLVLASQRHHHPLGRTRECTASATIFKNQTAVPFGFETRRYRRVNQRRGGPAAVRPRPDTLTFGPTGSRYPPPAAGPLDTDIRRGFKIPRTIEPAWRLNLRERAGR